MYALLIFSAHSIGERFLYHLPICGVITYYSFQLMATINDPIVLDTLLKYLLLFHTNRWWLYKWADGEREKHENKNNRNIRNPWIDIPHVLLHLCLLLRLSNMNEIITKEMVETGIVPEVIFDKVEEYKTALEWMETFKYQFQKFCEQYGYSKWETDYFLMNYIGETTSVRVDTKRMKETNVYIVNAETGEMEEVNAYEFFSKKSTVKAHVTYKEKK